MPLNLQNVKDSKVTVDLDDKGTYADNARKNFEKLVNDEIPSYKYMNVKQAFDGIQSDLNTLSNEPTKFNKNFPIADGVVRIPDTLMVGKADQYVKKEYDDEGNSTGNFTFKGIKLEVIDGNMAMALLHQVNDNFPAFERLLSTMCSFDVIVENDDYKLADNELREKYVGEFVQFEDFYLLPKWYSYTNEILDGGYNRIEPNAGDVVLLSHNKK